jgi:hypothetical protein
MVITPSVCWDRDGVTARGEKLAIAAIAPNTLMADLRVMREPIVKIFECSTTSPFGCDFVCDSAMLSSSLSAFVSAVLEVIS